MKPFTQLLSCLLVASVALLNSGAAWSDTQSNESLTKSSATATTKKAKKPHRKAKTTLKKSRKSHHKAIAAAKAPSSSVQPAVAQKPLQPDSTAPIIVAKQNPYLPGAAAAMASAPNPYMPAAVPFAPVALATPVVASMPAVAKATPPTTPAPVAAAPAPVAAVQTPPQKAASTAKPAINPYLFNSVAFNQAASTASTASMTSMANPANPANPAADLGQVFNSLREFLPDLHLPSPDIDILPSIKKVQPTGEKPLYVLTFKCPTELIGITPPPTKALRWLISSGMEAANSTNLLPFNMQQVCQ